MSYHDPALASQATGRRSERREADEPSTLRGEIGQPADVRVHDISPHGFLCEAELELAVGEQVTLGMGRFGSVSAIVRRRAGQRYGCEFVDPITSLDQLDRLSGEVVGAGRFSASPRGRDVFMEEAPAGPIKAPNVHAALAIAASFLFVACLSVAYQL